MLAMEVVLCCAGQEEVSREMSSGGMKLPVQGAANLSVHRRRDQHGECVERRRRWLYFIRNYICRPKGLNGGDNFAREAISAPD